MNARRKLFFLSGKGGAPAFDPDAQAQIDRITAAGGVIESPELLNADVVFLKSLGLYGNLKYAVDPACGIDERESGDTFVPTIYDYSGSNADTANSAGSEQPKKSTLNGFTALEFDGDDDRLFNVDGISFPAGTEVFSIAVYSIDYENTSSFGQLIDKYSPEKAGFQYGNFQGGFLRAFLDTGEDNSAYSNTQVLGSGTRDSSNNASGFINEVLLDTATLDYTAIGKMFGKILQSVSGNYAKGKLQKNWDFDIIPTSTQKGQIYAYIKAQKNISY